MFLVLYGMEWIFLIFLNLLCWMFYWSLEMGFIWILLNEYYVYRVMYYILNDFFDEFFIYDFSFEKNIIGDFRLVLLWNIILYNDYILLLKYEYM